MQRGVVGATNLNLALQEAINPTEHEIFMWGRGAVMMPKETLRRSGFAFRAEDRTLKVNFDNRSIEYDMTELDGTQWLSPQGGNATRLPPKCVFLTKIEVRLLI